MELFEDLKDWMYAVILDHWFFTQQTWWRPREKAPLSLGLGVPQAVNGSPDDQGVSLMSSWITKSKEESSTTDLIFLPWFKPTGFALRPCFRQKDEKRNILKLISKMFYAKMNYIFSYDLWILNLGILHNIEVSQM